MAFSKYLRRKLTDEGIDSKLLVAKLQLFNPVFEKLDPVTLSRWLNGHTLPSLEKQLLALQCLESKFYPYLEYIDTPPVPRSSTKVYEGIFNDIESSYHNILTYKDSELDIKPSIEEVNWSQLRNSVLNFYESISSYKDLCSEVEEYNQSNMIFCSIRDKSRVISHLSISTDIDIISSIFRGGIDIEFNSDSIFFNIGYYACRKHYNILVGVLLNYICDKYENSNELYVIARGTDFLSLIESFGGELVSANRENRMIGNVYLLKLNLIEVLCNPFIFSLIKEFYEVYQEINDQN